MNSRKTLPRDLLRVEKRLLKVLQPVEPDMAFVNDLRAQLDLEMAVKIKNRKVRTGLLVAGGIVGVVVMYVTLIRSIMNWPAAVQALAQKFRKREQPASI